MEKITIGAHSLPIYRYNTVVVGSGAAGYNAADHLADENDPNAVALITEGRNAGTSRNTGSDKQTYYKLTLSGNEKDSVADLAETLYSGGCVDGDIALCEAAMSAQCFLRLVELGVPFPQNAYGEYVGYKTDHDPLRRASSVGPYTSKIMTECLEQSVVKKGVPLFDKMQAIRILVEGNAVSGLLCLNRKNDGDRYALFLCNHIVYAVGGPAGIYRDSIYPESQFGASGIAFEAGVTGKNMTEWQYGIGTICPKWNVSGSYMQSLPRFFSVDSQGNDEREFLDDYFDRKGTMLSRIFMKGYQWPFDARKVAGGSSILDVLVHYETRKGRRVYMDFRQNAGEEPIDFTGLEDEPRAFLERTKACFGTPIQRLQRLNEPAIQFFRDRGVDLYREPVEIAVCAQHNNGGLEVDTDWKTNVGGLFAVGEVACTHGIYRPGGSALNAGQVGAARAARYIRLHGAKAAPQRALGEGGRQAVSELLDMERDVISNVNTEARIWLYVRDLMSKDAGPFRNPQSVAKDKTVIWQLLRDFRNQVKVECPEKLWKVFRLRDTLITQFVLLSVIEEYAARLGGSRGSALYSDITGTCPAGNLPADYRFTVDDATKGSLIQQVAYGAGCCRFHWRQARPIPTAEETFEDVWRAFRTDQPLS